jgi:hypothetical protein
MCVSKYLLFVGLVGWSTVLLSVFAATQQSDQVIAERVLGPQWRQLSRRAGMIFAGTVLTSPTQPVGTGTVTNHSAATNRSSTGTTPTLELSFRVDQAIAGVEPGQLLTIHEWAGAWSAQRSMIEGQHFLIFLYRPSRLGLTSPVGGALGQLALDTSGQKIAKDSQNRGVQEPGAQVPRAAIGRRKGSTSTSGAPLGTETISVVQLVRAIRSARGE